MADNRDEILTLSFTRRQWDEIRSQGWFYGSKRTGAWDRFVDSVDAGRPDRMAAEKIEIEAALPQLTDATKKAVTEEITRLVHARNTGTLNADHLGRPTTQIDGFAVSCTPYLHRAHPSHPETAAIQFRYAKSLWFNHLELPLRDEDRQWAIDTVHAITGQDGGVWNASNPYVNISWIPPQPNES